MKRADFVINTELYNKTIENVLEPATSTVKFLFILLEIFFQIR